MANLAQTIIGFQNGASSRKEFFAQLDKTLAAGQTNTAGLLRILDEQNARAPLPPDVYSEARRRIEGLAGMRRGAINDETCVQTKPGEPLPFLDSTGGRDAPRQADSPERVKGIGDTLNGRFVLEECIGFGGMGTVYRALDLRKLEASDRKPYIAIKVLNAQFRGHPKSLIALQREARKAQALAHPNIVSVYDFDRDGAMVYLTMEYLVGKPLSHELRAPGFKGMPYAEAMHIVEGMGRALAYAHERGFVHCDFKPANVFLTDRGAVKVIDFGIARVFQKPEQEADATVFDAGSLGALTPAYASPEMLEHREPDPRDDIYALACITYEMLTGRHPFDRVAATQARDSGMKPLPPKSLGRRQWRALRAALSLRRETRTPSVAQFLQEMTVPRRNGRLVLGLAGGGVALALLAAGVGYFWESRDESPRPAAEAPAPPPTLAMVRPVLGAVPCSALAPELRERALRVRGYVGKDYGVERLQQTLTGIPGIAEVALEVEPVDADKCGELQSFAPYWVSNRLGGAGATLHTRKRATELVEGDPLVLDLTTPGYDSYVHVDYYMLGGSVVHMVPSRRARAHQAPPNYSATIGSFGNWVIGKPFGTELLVLLVTPVPLFETLRPESESKDDYLRAVATRLEQIAEKHGADKIAADFLQITTRARADGGR
jgi:hypothetical protein